MKIRITLDVPDAIRRALRRRNGGSGLATRKELLFEHHAVWFAHMEDIAFDDALPIEEEIEEENE